MEHTFWMSPRTSSSLIYDANNVMLTMRRNSIAIADLAGTPNQRSAARSIDDFAAQNQINDSPLIGKLLGLNKPRRR